MFYTIYDEMAKKYSNPVLLENDDVAVRSFIAFINGDQLRIDNNKDFSIYRIGSWDSTNGVIETCKPEMLKRGL